MRAHCVVASGTFGRVVTVYLASSHGPMLSRARPVNLGILCSHPISWPPSWKCWTYSDLLTSRIGVSMASVPCPRCAENHGQTEAWDGFSMVFLLTTRALSLADGSM